MHGELAYKQGVFNGVRGEKLTLDRPLSENFAKGNYLGQYLREAHSAGIEYEKAMVYVKRASDISAPDAPSLINQLKNLYGISEDVPQSVFLARENLAHANFEEEELAALKRALAGEGGAPAWYETYSIVPGWAHWWLLLLVMQNTAFIFYFVNSLGENFTWYLLPLHKAWLYGGIPFLLPAALPLIFIFLSGVAMRRGYSSVRKKLGEYRIKRNKNMALDDDVLALSRERTLKLKQRIGEVK